MLAEVKIMPITVAPRGCELEVRKVGADGQTKKHVRELGISEGSKVTLLSQTGGNVILVVKEGRLCLDKTLAGKILVS